MGSLQFRVSEKEIPGNLDPSVSPAVCDAWYNLE